MGVPIRIGEKYFKFKKDAISYYREILNAYSFGKSLSESHFFDLIDLLNYGGFDITNYYQEERSFSDSVIDIKVSKVQFNTKCFEIFYGNGTSHYISYRLIINQPKRSDEFFFYSACRNSIHQDIRAVKQKYFDECSKKGKVKCQETGTLSLWEELVVDHRQPNTFSVIVDRFKELNSIDCSTVEYFTDEQNIMRFYDVELENKFKQYHKEKARLRIIRKECNSSRTSLARIKKLPKDRTIE